jgi:hypothetical protein
MAQFSQTGAAVDPETGEPIAPQPAPPPAAQTPEPVAPPQQPAPAAQEPVEPKWEQKYHTLKGMFDAEVPRLNEAVRQLSGQVNALVAENQTLKTAAPAPAPATQTPLVTDQDKESFGADLVNLIERATTQATAPLLAKITRLEGENGQLKSQVGNVSQQVGANSQETFITRLSQRVSDLSTVNVDPGFLAWLQQVDPIYGMPRQMALDNAVKTLDVDRSATIFEAYKATLTPPPANVNNPQAELNRQVTPPRTRTSAPPQTEQKLNWTPQSIEAFYSDLRRGLIPADMAVKLEADLNAAVAEGRV